MNFDSHLDGVVAVCAALVNVATPGERQGRPYSPPPPARLVGEIGDALQLGQRAPNRPTRARVPAFVELAAQLRPVFAHIEDGDVDAAARAVNRLLDRFRPRPRLEHHDGQPWHLHVHGPREDDPSGWGASTAMALATVLGSEQAHRLGVCEAPHCDRVFVDVSRNAMRRFCSEACQNRVKAAAHRARQR